MNRSQRREAAIPWMSSQRLKVLRDQHQPHQVEVYHVLNQDHIMPVTWVDLGQRQVWSRNTFQGILIINDGMVHVWSAHVNYARELSNRQEDAQQD